ncbi:MAG TPA: TonB-dependent receptor [Burkholderiales bacterium]|nr:TonB-dependent receptor [Burkholderiales bacterium]
MLRVVCCAAAFGAASFVHAQNPELDQLRNELKKLQLRIEEIEKRQSPPAPQAPAAKPVNPESAFNPGITLILQGTAARSSRDPEQYRISGFAPSGGEVAPPGRGFSLGESELVVGGNIDPYFRGNLVAALTPENEVEVEEAYVQTLRLGQGFTLKGGRFLSGIGYQNEIHQHAWDFQDAPLAYKAFLGGRLSDDGVQLRWIAPSDLFVELGTELGRGRSFPDTERTRNGAAAWSVFGRIGGDVGTAAWRAGLSFLRASPQGRSFEDVDSLGTAVTQDFTGRSRLWIADAVVKWSKLKLQGEYFRRRESGTLGYDDTAGSAAFGAVSGDYASRQSGWYAQAVYEFMPRWRAGARYDRLSRGEVSNAIIASGLGPASGDFPLLMSDHDPRRTSLMVDWSPTEFSRLRLQWANDRSAEGMADRQVLLQYIHTLGAHGAHRF